MERTKKKPTLLTFLVLDCNSLVQLYDLVFPLVDCPVSIQPFPRNHPVLNGSRQKLEKLACVRLASPRTKTKRLIDGLKLKEQKNQTKQTH